MMVSKEYTVRTTRFDDFIEIKVKNIFGNCIILKKDEKVAEITYFVACSQKKELLQRAMAEVSGCQIFAYVNHADLRVFTEQGFEAQNDFVPPPMGGYGIKQLTTMVKFCDR